ncbi:MAG TPA: GIY-YIG nuclease family protein [Thermoplasmatales archaeon]|nr:GIY-YIG nuclease family protein [Thermoplasmatales archaeon]
MNGCYILVIKLNKDTFIEIGKLGEIFFKKNFYAYVGSAMNGLERRINRHLRKNKKTYWHVDYLLNCGKIKHVFYKESHKREECDIAGKLMRKLPMIPGFGCSDCSCRSHLFYGNKETIFSNIKELKMKTYVFNETL